MTAENTILMMHWRRRKKIFKTNGKEEEGTDRFGGMNRTIHGAARGLTDTEREIIEMKDTEGGGNE